MNWGGHWAVRQKPVVERARVENSGVCVPFTEIETGLNMRQRSGKVGRCLMKRDLGICPVDVMSGSGQKGAVKISREALKTGNNLLVSWPWTISTSLLALPGMYLYRWMLHESPQSWLLKVFTDPTL